MAAGRGLDDQRIMQALRQLESNKPPAVAKAAQQLMKLAPGDPRIEEILCRRLDDPCLRVRAIVASALGELKLAKRVQPGAGTIAITATNMGGTSFLVKVCPSYNVLGLKELLAQVVNTTPANLTLLLDTTVLEDSWVLSEHGLEADAEISFAMVSDGDPKQDASIEPLVRRLDDKNERCKMEALGALQRLAPTNPCLVEPLLGCLQREFSCDNGGSLQVAVTIAKWLGLLEPDNQIFANELVHGFWQEVRRNLQFFAQQRDPLHRIEQLSTLAEILATVAPDDEDAGQRIHFFRIYRLRVLGGTPQIKIGAAKVIGQLEVNDPSIREAFLKLVQKDTQFTVLMSAVNTLMQVPLDDLRLVESMLSSRKCPVQKREVRNIAAVSLGRHGTLIENIVHEQGLSTQSSAQPAVAPLTPTFEKGYSSKFDYLSEKPRQPIAEIADAWDT